MRSFFLVCALFLLPASALAQGDSKARARALIAKADKAYEASRYLEAAEAYLEAQALLEKEKLGSKPELYYNAGLAFERAGQCDRTVELFERFLKLRPDRASDDLYARLEKAKNCAPQVVVQSEPVGAEVTIDGAARGKTPVTIHLRSGAHTIVAAAEGYEKHERAFAVEPGKPVALSLKLEPLVKSGRISFDVATQALISIDGEHIAKGPYRGIRVVSAGPHKVMILEPGCRGLEITVDVPAGGEPMAINSPALCLPPDGPPGEEKKTTELVTKAPVLEDTGPSNTGLWISGGVAVAAVVAGTVFTVLSNGAASDRDTMLEQPEDMRDGQAIRRLDNRAFTHSIGAGISFSTAAIGAAVAAVLALSGDEE
jgi:hypothetical protein